ncbi:hypothetical protein ABNN70_05985 [Sporolactobacillus sp. Y61]|uniref:DeoR-like transcriptional repressor C-terminal sensor domain-containing protein n=1 Tax=Sporolactobacillus sp. Y61 TaxID=3160863 RepID=A0AAU8IJC3_9BACL
MPADRTSKDDGITDYDLNGTSLSRLLMQRSEKSIVLADHSKIGVTTFAHLKEVSTLITNGECPADIQQALKENGVKLLSSTYADQDPV